MFTKPRPVPSKAALRVLYQLAYISSGTAVGVGVLCAEERRRRTQIVQRVADNARKIRQHPRYMANAALAARESEGSVEGVCKDGRALQAGDAEGRHDRGRRGRNREEAVKGQELPSVVEHEYGAVAADERRRSVRRSRNGTGHAGAGQTKPRTEATSESIQATPSQPVQGWFVRRLDGVAHHGLSKPMGSNVRHKDHPLADEQLQERSKTASLNDGDRVTQEDAIAHCHELLDKRRVSEAMEYSIRCLHIPPSLMPKRLFDAALEEKMFGECAALLRLEKSYSRAFGSRCSALILACGQYGEYDILLDLLYRENRTSVSLHDDSLAQDLRCVLAVACATDDGLFHHFERLYCSLSKATQGRLIKELRHTLLTTWRTTKSPDAVLEKLHPIRKQLETIGDTKALRLVDQTMVEIYVRAGRTPEAMDMIARLHRADPSDMTCVLKAATIYARRQAWGPFHQAIHICASAPMLELGMDLTKTLNGVVHAYVPHHSAAQIWKFVTYLQGNLAYRPDAYANRIILGAFVERKAVELIPAWLHTLKVAGQEFKIHDKTAAHLLSRYYTQYRPSHVLVMWFCRNLTHLAPSFDPATFLSLIQQSIASDLSGCIERNSVWQREHAQQRLDRLADVANQIPPPGYKYSHRLYFQHPGSSPQDPLAGADAQQVGSGEDGSFVERDADDAADAVRTAQDSRADLPSLESLLMPSIHTNPEASRPVDRMAVKLSSKEYQAVLDLYDRLDKTGVQSSIDALIMAVRASIKLHGDDDLAQQMIERAERAGTNTMTAIVPVIIHRMRKLDHSDWNGAFQVLNAATRYYKVGFEKGTDTAPHVGVTAANLLITKGWPGYGVRLLHKMLEESWATKRSVEIVFMIVMIKGYVALGSIRNVLYWVREILHLDVQIRPHLLRVLKRAAKTMQLPRRDLAHLSASIAMCEARRQKQAFEAKVFGKKLVSVLARCMRGNVTIDVDERAQLDRELFGPTIERGEADEGAGSEPGQAASQTKSPTTYRRLLRSKERVAEAIRMDPDAAAPDERRQAERLNDERWLRQYRAFLRKPIVLENGRPVPFRYYLPTESRSQPAQGRAARRRARLAERKARSERFWETGRRSGAEKTGF